MFSVLDLPQTHFFVLILHPKIINMQSNGTKKLTKKRGLYLLACLACIFAVASAVALLSKTGTPSSPRHHYEEIEYPTQNYHRGLNNDVEGVILHHTALPTIERSLEMLTLPKNIVSTHCLIDTDGTRYILAQPGIVTYHAGLSELNGREKCNEFCIGIEFQGNTVEQPLTDDQISSAIEYLLPVIEQYHIPLKNIVTHETVRANYMKLHPENTRVKDKCDITQPEYHRVMDALKAAMEERKG